MKVVILEQRNIQENRETALLLHTEGNKSLLGYHVLMLLLCGATERTSTARYVTL